MPLLEIQSDDKNPLELLFLINRRELNTVPSSLSSAKFLAIFGGTVHQAKKIAVLTRGLESRSFPWTRQLLYYLSCHYCPIYSLNDTSLDYFEGSSVNFLRVYPSGTNYWNR